MSRHVVRSASGLPPAPECDDLDVFFHERGEITGPRAEALRRCLSVRYGVPVDQNVGDPIKDSASRLDTLLSTLSSGNTIQKRRYQLEYEDAKVSRIPPAETTTYGDLHFYVEEDRGGA